MLPALSERKRRRLRSCRLLLRMLLSRLAVLVVRVPYRIIRGMRCLSRSHTKSPLSCAITTHSSRALLAIGRLRTCLQSPRRISVNQMYVTCQRLVCPCSVFIAALPCPALPCLVLLCVDLFATSLLPLRSISWNSVGRHAQAASLSLVTEVQIHLSHIHCGELKRPNCFLAISPVAGEQLPAVATRDVESTYHYILLCITLCSFSGVCLLFCIDE